VIPTNPAFAFTTVTLTVADEWETAAAIYSDTSGIKGRAATVLAARNGAVWATTSSAVYRLDNGHVSEVQATRWGQLFEDHQGTLYLASDGGLEYFKGDRFAPVPRIPAGAIDAIAEDSKGTLWLAHRTAGLLHRGRDGSVGRIPWVDLLGRQDRASTLLVDPTDDSLWMGVPLVTLIGATVVGRAGYSQLANLGLPELVASNPDSYVAIAASLAGDLERLSRLRRTLRMRMQQSPIMDAKRFAANVELAYRGMWRRWCAGRVR